MKALEVKAPKGESSGGENLWNPRFEGNKH